MNAKTDHSFTFLAAVIIVGVIAALVSPSRAAPLPHAPTAATALR